MTVCPNCQAPVRAEGRFCRSCGQRLEAEAPGDGGTAAGDVTIEHPLPEAVTGPAPVTAGTVLPPIGPSKGGVGSGAPARVDLDPVLVVDEPVRRKRMALWLVAGGVVAVVVAAIAGALILRSGNDEVVASVPAQAIRSDEVVTVRFEDDDRSPRAHDIPLDRDTAATVVVVADGPFEPEVSVSGPNGAPVDARAVGLAGENGAAVSFTARRPGDHTVTVAGFGDALDEYTADLRLSRFRTPDDVALGDCVTRLEGERWGDVSGFLLRPCDRSHEGQVFEQLADFEGNEAEANAACDEARNERIEVPGFVEWRVYFGDGLTCVLVRDGGEAKLDRSLVTNV